MSNRPIEALKHALGLDQAIAYMVLARGVAILGSTGTVLLIVHFLSPVEQGYYYTLLSLVSLQAIFEMGFSFVIQQLAAHESVHLNFAADGTVSGAPEAHSRLASILHLLVRWYSRAAVGLLLILVPGGWVFFLHRHASDHVAWQLPWTLAGTACAASLLLAPFYSFLDGCGQVRQVARLRLGEAAAALITAWCAMVFHKGLYAPFLMIAGQVMVGVVFLWRRRRLFAHLYRHPHREARVSWRHEVLPFQWKIAVSWMCAYFTAQAFIPLLFSLRGPVEAGQMGMSLSITGYMSVLLLAWISTKATPFGQMIARGDIAGLDHSFFKAFRQSASLLAGLALAAMAFMVAIQQLYPRLAARLVSPLAFALLLLTMMSTFTMQSLAIYLRSFKREPFLWLYLVTAILSVGLVFLTARRWGVVGTAGSYFFSTGAIGLAAAVIVFQRYRRGLSRKGAQTLKTETAS